MRSASGAATRAEGPGWARWWGGGNNTAAAQTPPLQPRPPAGPAPRRDLERAAPPLPWPGLLLAEVAAPASPRCSRFSTTAGSGCRSLFLSSRKRCSCSKCAICRCKICTSVSFWATSFSALSRSMPNLAFASSLGGVGG